MYVVVYLHLIFFLLIPSLDLYVLSRYGFREKPFLWNERVSGLGVAVCRCR